LQITQAVALIALRKEPKDLILHKVTLRTLLILLSAVDVKRLGRRSFCGMLPREMYTTELAKMLGDDF
jgi:hypothetical protein